MASLGALMTTTIGLTWHPMGCHVAPMGAKRSHWEGGDTLWATCRDLIWDPLIPYFAQSLAVVAVIAVAVAVVAVAVAVVTVIVVDVAVIVVAVAVASSSSSS